MIWLYIEENSSLFFKKAENWIAEQNQNVQVILQNPTNLPLPRNFGTVLTLAQISSHLTQKSADQLEEIILRVTPLIDSTFDKTSFRDAVKKALRYCFCHPAYTLALQDISSGQKIFVITRWKDLHDFFPHNQLEIIPIQKIHANLHWLRFFLIIRDFAGSLGKSILNSLSKTESHKLGKSKIAIVSQYLTQLDLFQSLLSKWPADEIVFFIHSFEHTLSKEEKNKIHEFKNQLSSQGYAWIESKRKAPLRQLLLGMQTVYQGLGICIFSKNPSLQMAILRNKKSLCEWQWELSDFLKKSPSKVLLTQEERSPRGNMTEEACKQNHHTSINICNGMMFDNDPLLKNSPALDAWTVFGEKGRDLLTHAGISPASIHITGHLASEYWLNLKNLLDQDESLNTKPMHVVYFSQPLNQWIIDSREPISNILKDLILKYPQIKCSVKLHPAESDDFLSNFWKEFPEVRIFDSNTHPHDLFKTCTLAIGASSTVLFEAMASGIRVGIFEPTNLFADFFESGIAFDLFSSNKPSDDLFDFMNHPLTNLTLKKTIPVLSSYLGDLDGKSHVRIRNLIESFLR